MSLHPHILHNCAIKKAQNCVLSAGQTGLLNGLGVFSTLRVQNGCLFAWPRHWSRLLRDAHLLSVEIPDEAELVSGLHRLIEANRAADCTLRVVIVRNTGGMWADPAIDRASDVIALTAPRKSWPAAARLAVQPSARFAANEFSGAKILSWAQNLTWLERAQLDGFDEVVLLNERDEVAECTSANLFAVFGSEIVTPPLNAGCLPGITREILLEKISLPGYVIVERNLRLSDLYSADEVFMTSTTRGLLPVAEIAGELLNSRSTARERLAVAFREFADAEISSGREAVLSA